MSIALNPVAEPTADQLFADYRCPPGVFDEYFRASGELRPHAQRFVDELRELPLAELSRRRELATRQIYENSVTYNAPDESERSNRPWKLDVLPLLIEAAEWKQLSQGLGQRAELLNLILADIYGPQKLISRGLLPPELVFANPNFLRPIHGLKAPDDLFLHIYAADLSRTADGTWWVTADRTEMPSGAGYALENRLVSSAMYPDSFRAQHVQRLAPFFLALRERLERLAPRHRDNPRIVLLSEGPSNPNYFEDAYLSRYLGYMVVEGGDLAMRDNQVQLKTLGGLLPVDVVLRRVDDADCDPLELRAESWRGVSGLTQAVRTGGVALANALGSGLLESPAFLALLPRLCRELLGQELLLGSIPTWWCGQPEALQDVLSRPDELTLRSCYRQRDRTGIRLGQLSKERRRMVLQRLREAPEEFVAQEPAGRSVTPVWEGGRAQPWHVALRTYLVHNGREYACMPGGLVRVSPSTGMLDEVFSSGEASKDAWVLSEGPVSTVTLLRQQGMMELRRSGAELPSRIADNLFWLGRHVERCDGAARVLRTTVSRLVGESAAGESSELPLLARILAEKGLIEPAYAVEGFGVNLPALESGLPRFVFNEAEPSSLLSMITSMNRTASLVRERLSGDSWRVLNRIYHDFQQADNGRGAGLSQLLAQLNRLTLDLASFSGMVMEGMTRTLGWRFLDLGRRLERALHVVLLTRGLLIRKTWEPPAMEAVLEMADSLITYRSRYLNNMQLPPLLDLLLTDESNPRSLAYQLLTLVDHIEQLPRISSQPLRSQDQRLGLMMLTSVRMLADDLLNVTTSHAGRNSVERLLRRMSNQLPKLAEVISQKYLIHAGLPRQLMEFHVPRDTAGDLVWRDPLKNID